jgi:glycogen synthase
MKLLLVSRFPPSLGGLETMAVLIAREWSRVPGLELRVVTDVAGTSPDNEKYQLVRCPSLRELTRLYQWADTIFFNHAYLRLALPLLWIRRPYVVSMSGTLPAVNGKPWFADYVRNFCINQLLQKADRNIAACGHVQRNNPVASVVIPNPFDADVFYTIPGTPPPTLDFFFGGRINQAAKGCLDLMTAFAECCRASGKSLTLSVAGDGPDLPAMKSLANQLSLGGQIRFLGILSGPALAAELRKHRYIVIPSRYQEPIGIICLEGIACGCIAIGSEGGGLGESVGPCGLIFKNGDVPGLTACMIQMVNASPSQHAAWRDAAASHLQNYLPGEVTKRYLAEATAAAGV